jgi:hypothetical protein
MADWQAQRLPLAPTLSRKRERARAGRVIGLCSFCTALDERLLPLAAEGGAIGCPKDDRPSDTLWRRMRISLSAFCRGAI